MAHTQSILLGLLDSRLQTTNNDEEVPEKPDAIRSVSCWCFVDYGGLLFLLPSSSISFLFLSSYFQILFCASSDSSSSPLSLLSLSPPSFIYLHETNTVFVLCNPHTLLQSSLVHPQTHASHTHFSLFLFSLFTSLLICPLLFSSSPLPYYASSLSLIQEHLLLSRSQ